MAMRVLVLGAGFGGLELTATLAAEVGDETEVTLIDQADAFVFGYSKLDVMFGRADLEAVRLPYEEIAAPEVRFRQERIIAIEPGARRVRTESDEYEADVLVVALGADYDLDATPGLAQGGNEFYSVDGAARLGELLEGFDEGRAVIGVCGAPFKCPPAPSEAALLLHDHLSERGVRDRCEISFLMALPSPVPPSPETSRALEGAFAERGVEFRPGSRVAEIDPQRSLAVLDGGEEVPFDLFLGVPRHRAPDVVIESGMTTDGYVPVDPATLATAYPGVYAIGDVATVGVPKAGVFAEGAARVVAERLIAQVRSGRDPAAYDGRGSCYIEFGGGRVGRVDVDFLSGPKPTGKYWEPSQERVREKEAFGSSRRARWFGR